ncbi:MAG TPA: ABC transporter ATP-binding protein [Permianibacter sp.]|nr:ABC transporter ATP-binding protein [Permianibacter sp.]
MNTSASTLVQGRGIHKAFGKHDALGSVDFRIEKGRIVGLIGSNGAGKTTLLRAMLGLTDFDGELSVLGMDPRTQRDQLMERVAYIADVAILPRWLRVDQAVDYVDGVHPRFSRERCMQMLAKTEIPAKAKIGTLSKGMVAQLHLALVLAIDAELLILDEPTLGLDIVYRKAFYETLLGDYYERERTIVLTTHQVEEVQHLLTDILLISKGRLVLDATMDAVSERYTEVMVAREQLEAARAMKPISDREVFGRHVLMFENIGRDQLRSLGELRTPGIADVFVAKMTEARA